MIDTPNKAIETEDQLSSLLDSFYLLLHQQIARCWESGAWTDHFRCLAESAGLFNDDLQRIGQQSSLLWEDHRSPDGGLISFRWMDQAKALMILWRDVLFQQQKAHIFFVEKRLPEKRLATLQQAAHQTVVTAADQFQNYFTEEKKHMRSGRGGSVRQVNRWTLQANPWPVYREHISMLAAQTRQMVEQHAELLQVVEEFQQLKQALHHQQESLSGKFRNIQALAHTTVQFIETHAEDKPGVIKSHIEDLERQVQSQMGLLEITRPIEEGLNRLPTKISVALATVGGMLQLEELNLQRRTRQWMESEILPILYEQRDLTIRLLNNWKMSLVNIRNRVIILQKEQEEELVSQLELGQPLHSFLEKAAALHESLNKQQGLTKDRIDQLFGVSRIYEVETVFLPVPLEATIYNLKIEKHPIFSRIRRWWFRQLVSFQRFKETARQEEILSLSEKVVRYVQSRTINKENAQYNSIFSTKGYIGESFWVGRESELKRIRNVIGQWRLGFRGSTLIHGKRFSGKTLFGEIVVNRYFEGKVIRLRPNASLSIHGRQMETTANLEEALAFIRKYSTSHSLCIWMDDLELWSDAQHSLSQNVRALQKYIDDLSSKLFFLISASNWVKARLERTHDLEKVFQSEIGLTRMDMDEIQEAILIRHGATHKALVDQAGRELKPNEFKKIMQKIYKSSDGVIGQALINWMLSTQPREGNTVIHKWLHNSELPDFLDPDSAIILKLIMLEKRTNEYQLRKYFGSPFGDKYANILQRLINLGVLTRDVNGFLEIRQTMANDLGKLLETHNYIEFNA